MDPFAAEAGHGEAATVYFFAASLRCQASRVAGVTGKTSAQRLRGTRPPDCSSPASGTAATPSRSAVVITHEHYDRGFRDVRVLEPWQPTEVGGVTVTAAPGKRGVPDVTYVLQGGDRTVYFGGDTLRIAELGELPAGSGPSTWRCCPPTDCASGRGHPAPLRLHQRLARRPDDHPVRPAFFLPNELGACRPAGASGMPGVVPWSDAEQGNGLAGGWQRDVHALVKRREVRRAGRGGAVGRADLD